MEVLEGVRAWATISANGRYRYRLFRWWGDGEEPIPALVVNFVMLNPSTADDVTDDRTIRKCQKYARAWGMSGIVVTNIFALRAREPRDLFAAVAVGQDPIGPDNNEHLVRMAAWAGSVVVAWGDGGRLGNRGAIVTQMLTRETGVHLECLGTTRHGRPRHPLYLPDDTRREVYR